MPTPEPWGPDGKGDTHPRPDRRRTGPASRAAPATHDDALRVRNADPPRGKGGVDRRECARRTKQGRKAPPGACFATCARQRSETWARYVRREAKR